PFLIWVLKRSLKMGPDGKKLLNIIILGFGFMFMFTAFQTCGNIEETRNTNGSMCRIACIYFPG
ncbi:hypothetical protein XENOCAPTIV_018956, partial [Xenoophorus captivus]